MKRMIVTIFVFLLIAGNAFSVALASSPPDPRSYFTDPQFNKTFTDGDGITHTYSVYEVAELWNKIGTIWHQVYYKDIYTADGAEYHTTGLERFYYENAGPLYPDAEEYTVYVVSYYPDGSKVVKTDLRYDTSTTPEVTATATPAITVTATPAPVNTPTPTPTPTKIPVATVTKMVTPTPTPKVTESPTKPTLTSTADTEPSPTKTSTISPIPMATDVPVATDQPGVTQTTMATDITKITPTPMAGETTNEAIITPSLTPMPMPTPMPTSDGAVLNIPFESNDNNDSWAIGIVIAVAVLVSVIGALFAVKKSKR